MIARIDKPKQADERTTLLAFLQHQRDTLLMKVEGLDDDQLRATLAPSDLTLGGMLAHLAYVEDWWLPVCFLGEPPAQPWNDVDWESDNDFDWHCAAGMSRADLLRLYDAAVTRSDEVIAAAGLDDLAVAKARNGEPFSMRWIVLHLLEEYARHCGHADLIRQSIDGATGY